MFDTGVYIVCTFETFVNWTFFSLVVYLQISTYCEVHKVGMFALTIALLQSVTRSSMQPVESAMCNQGKPGKVGCV